MTLLLQDFTLEELERRLATGEGIQQISDGIVVQTGLSREAVVAAIAQKREIQAAEDAAIEDLLDAEDQAFLDDFAAQQEALQTQEGTQDTFDAIQGTTSPTVTNFSPTQTFEPVPLVTFGTGTGVEGGSTTGALPIGGTIGSSVTVRSAGGAEVGISGDSPDLTGLIDEVRSEIQTQAQTLGQTGLSNITRALSIRDLLGRGRKGFGSTRLSNVGTAKLRKPTLLGE